MGTGFVLGTAIPFLFFNILSQPDRQAFFGLLIAGSVLTVVFITLAYLVSLNNDNRLKGFGIIIIIWLCYAVLYDAFFMLALIWLQQYPLEKITLALTLLNPVDASRIFIILQLNNAALLGYTGAVLHNFFSSGIGTLVTILVMTCWFLVPFWFVIRLSNRKDF
jgi:Cu-processing system permease protein